MPRWQPAPTRAQYETSPSSAEATRRGWLTRRADDPKRGWPRSARLTHCAGLARLIKLRCCRLGWPLPGAAESSRWPRPALDRSQPALSVATPTACTDSLGESISASSPPSSMSPVGASFTTECSVVRPSPTSAGVLGLPLAGRHLLRSLTHSRPADQPVPNGPQDNPPSTTSRISEITTRKAN
jgi:hypothetical protein